MIINLVKYLQKNFYIYSKERYIYKIYKREWWWIKNENFAVNV